MSRSTRQPDKSFEAIRLKACVGLCGFSLAFLLISVWLIRDHAAEQERLGQVIGDNRQLVENTRLLQGAVDQVQTNLIRQTDRLKSKSEALASSEQARLELERERRARLEEAQRRADRVASVRRSLAPALARTDALIFLDDRRITLRLPGGDLFASGEAVLQPGGQAILSSVALALSEHLPGAPIRIEGHTDNVAIGPSLAEKFPSNWHLSATRAAAAAEFLTRLGILQASRIEVVGLGDTRPVADNTSEEGRAQNRRIDIVINLEEAGEPVRAVVVPMAPEQVSLPVSETVPTELPPPDPDAAP